MSQIFTEKLLSIRKTPEKRTVLTDTTTNGLQLWIHPSGQKSLAWSRRINGRLYFRSLGLWPVEVSVSQARDEVDKLNGSWRIIRVPKIHSRKKSPRRTTCRCFLNWPRHTSFIEFAQSRALRSAPSMTCGYMQRRTLPI
jgi:hypothetical protein